MKLRKNLEECDCKAEMAAFRKSEDGSITVFTLFVLIVMLLMSGMAIDFLRFKSEQARIQDIGDRAVLAATKLSNTADPEDVVRSYFTANNAEQYLVGDPFIEDLLDEDGDLEFRRVAIATAVDIDTFFLRLGGIDQLGTSMVSDAKQGVGDIEISLVLDISFSMVNRGDAKFEEMKDAAQVFVTEALKPEHDGKISVNLVPYAGAVNMGPEMFEELNAEELETRVSNNGTPDDESDDIIYTHDNHCVLYERSDFTNTDLPQDGLLEIPRFYAMKSSYNVRPSTPGVTTWSGSDSWCPPSGSVVRYAQRTPGDVSTPGSLMYAIENLQPGVGTSTHQAFKFGMALLDPSSRDEFDELEDAGLIDPIFEDRPLDYDQLGVKKVIVVMTDGNIWHTRLPSDYYDFRNIDYDEAKGVLQEASIRADLRTNAQNVVEFNYLCGLAKDPSRDVEVFTVAFEANATAQAEMKACASTESSHFFVASANGLSDVFGQIASQISELRLTN